MHTAVRRGEGAARARPASLDDAAPTAAVATDRVLVVTGLCPHDAPAVAADGRASVDAADAGAEGGRRRDARLPC
eukprot:1951747-Prymnesium_polylepis.2